jgi:hypothetical protein
MDHGDQYPEPNRSVVQQVTATGGYAYATVRGDIHIHGDGSPLYVIRRDAAGLGLDGRGQPPSRLLDARSRVVPFTGRGRELDELRLWRDTGAGLAVRLLYGAGGVGKSRLAAELGADARKAGWRVAVADLGVGRAGPGPGGQDLDLTGYRGVLLVVDYADRWPLETLIWLLCNGLLYQPDRPARVLLLARSADGWPALRAELRRADIAADASLQALPELDTAGDGDRRSMLVAARDAFAAAYELAEPAAVAVPADLDHPDFGLVLPIHMAALVAVDAHACGARPPTAPDELTGYLLDREVDHWTRLYRQRLHGLSHHTPPEVMARVVFVATLVGPLGHADAVALLDRVESEVAGARLVTDHLRCYPPAGEDGDAVLEPLRPDLLAEDFLAHTLPGGRRAQPWAAALVQQILRRPADATQSAMAARAVTILAAAAARLPHVGARHLYPILQQQPMHAVVAGSATLSLIAADPAVDPAVLDAIDAALPPVSYVDVDLGAAAITKRVTEYRLVHAGEAERAAGLAVLGFRLANAGRHVEAVAAAEESITLYRRLIAAGRAEATGHNHVTIGRLGKALETLATAQAALGRFVEAATAGAEAVQCYRTMARADPELDRCALAICLNNLSNWLAPQNRADEAVAASREAVALLRPLAEAEPQRHGPHLAVALDTLGNRLLEADLPDEAFAASREAFALHRDAVTANPRANLPQYARALGNIGARMLALGQHEQARVPIREAMQHLRELDRDNPARDRHELANVLLNLGRAEDGPAALSAVTEAVELYRGLAAGNPLAHRGALVMALVQLGLTAERSDDTGTALDAYAEALQRYREAPGCVPVYQHAGLALLPSRLSRLLHLAGRDEEAVETIKTIIVVPDDRMLSRLRSDRTRAEVLVQQALAVSAHGSPEEAEQALARSIDALRELADEELGGHVIADPMEARVRLLGQLRRFAQAAMISRELVELRREQHRTDPPRHAPALLRALELLAVSHALCDSPDEAVQPAREAVALARELAQADPTQMDWLARTLDEFVGFCRAATEQPPDTLAAAQEAVDIWRRLPTADTITHITGLAGALDVLTHLHAGAGNRQAALVTAAEARTLLKPLTQRPPEAGTPTDDYLPAYATALYNLCFHLDATDRVDDETMTAFAEAVTVYRRLAEADPDTYRTDLAACLNGLARRLRSSGQHPEALQPATEAVAIRRDLAGTDPGRHLPDLAKELANLATLLTELGRPDDALAPGAEEVTIRRRLARTDPGRHLAGLAIALHDLSLTLQELGRHDEALAPATEAATIRRQLAQDDPGRYLPHLAAAAHNLARVQAELGAGREALTLAKEAVTIRRRLAAADPEQYVRWLAYSLTGYARVCLRTNRNLPGALRAASQSVELYTDLAEQNQAQYAGPFLVAYHLLADVLDRMGHTDEAARMRAVTAQP